MGGGHNAENEAPILLLLRFLCFHDIMATWTNVISSELAKPRRSSGHRDSMSSTFANQDY
jgi:hypothetical protein